MIMNKTTTLVLTMDEVRLLSLAVESTIGRWTEWSKSACSPGVADSFAAQAHELGGVFNGLQDALINFVLED